MFLCIILLATFSVSVAAIAEDDDSDYMVWTDKLNVRESPGTDAKIVTVLKMGDELTVDWLGSWVEKDGYYWVKVKSGNVEGWVAKLYIFPSNNFEVLKVADELGKANKADEMIAKLKQSYKVSVSPDGKQLVFQEVSLVEWQGGGPVAFFIAGEGLVDYIPMAGINAEYLKWSADSRYFANYSSIVYYGTLRIYDTNEHEVISTSPHTAFRGVFAWNGEKEELERYYEFVDGYLVWVAVEDPRSIGELYSVMLPYLAYYQLESGTMGIALTYDIQTIRKKEDMFEPEVKLLPTGSVPPEVMSSPLYKRCVNQYLKAAISEG